MEDVRKASNRLHQERWFRKSFYELENPNRDSTTVSLSDMKKFMTKISHKTTTSALKVRPFTDLLK